MYPSPPLFGNPIGIEIDTKPFQGLKPMVTQGQTSEIIIEIDTKPFQELKR